MSGYKYACPYCGQHIEYTDGYAGQKMPCPMCQHAIVFPAIPGGVQKSSLRLVRDTPKAVRQNHFSFVGVLQYLGAHWKIVGMCLVPFGILAGVWYGTASLRQSDPPAAPPVVNTANAGNGVSDIPVAHGTLPQATEQVKTQLAAIKQANVAVKAAEQKKTAIHLQYASTPGGEQSEKAADAALQTAQNNLTAAKAAFATAFTNYQSLGGTNDYRQQISATP